MIRASLSAAASLVLCATAFAGPQLGQLAPDFTLKDAEGKAHTLSDYRGQVVVLEWTNPDCPYVQRHYREGTMAALAGAYEDTSVVWLAVNTTHYNKPEDTRKWTKEKELSYPTLLDPDGRVGRLYDAKTTPHMFVIEPSGRLVYDGAIDDDQGGKKESSERVPYVDLAVKVALQGKMPETSQTRSYGCSVKYAK